MEDNGKYIIGAAVFNIDVKIWSNPGAFSEARLEIISAQAEDDSGLNINGLVASLVLDSDRTVDVTVFSTVQALEEDTVAKWAFRSVVDGTLLEDDEDWSIDGPSNFASLMDDQIL